MSTVDLEQEFDSIDLAYQSADCMAFNQLLETDLNSLSRLQATEQKWRAEILAGRMTFDAAFARQIAQRYRRWVEMAAIRVSQLCLQEEKGCYPELADDFRSRVEEVQANLEERSWSELGRRARARADEE